MSIRLRLAVASALVFGLVLGPEMILVYALHMRGHYDAVDRGLVSAAQTVRGSLHVRPGGPIAVPPLDEPAVVRIYDAEGRLLASTRAAGVPALDPRLARPTPSVSPLIAGLPRLGSGPPPAAAGVLTVVDAPSQRWRLYVLPVPRLGYIEALSPLGALDHSAAMLALLLEALWVAGAALAFAAAWLAAARVLRPLQDIVRTVEVIADTRDFDRRLQTGPARGELGRLARTFNRMLASLGHAYEAERRFASNASHELRASLGVLRGNAALLRERSGALEADDAAAVAEIERQSIALTRLVENSLALARMEAGGEAPRRLPLDLGEVAAELVPTAQRLARGQTVSLAIAEPAPAYVDPDHMRQILLILIDNAVRYTASDGHIEIGVRRVGQRAEISVRDDGIGIAAEDLPHVFRRFFRGGAAREHAPKGTGLGLNIAEWLAHLNGGAIRLRSRLGHGTCVAVSLPLHDPLATTSSESPQ